MDNSNNNTEQNKEATNENVENLSNQTENEMKPNESEQMVQSPVPTSPGQETKTDESNLINLTVKTPKEKENVTLRPGATIKDVRRLVYSN